MVDSQGDSKNTVSDGGKMKLDGKEYDFVFDIEVEEGKVLMSDLSFSLTFSLPSGSLFFSCSLIAPSVPLLLNVSQ